MLKRIDVLEKGPFACQPLHVVDCYSNPGIPSAVFAQSIFAVKQPSSNHTFHWRACKSVHLAQSDNSPASPYQKNQREQDSMPEDLSRAR